MGKKCHDSLHFYSSGKYEEYYCDTKVYIKGRYNSNKDTLTLIAYQKISEIMYNLPQKLIVDSTKYIPAYAIKYLVGGKNHIKKIYFKDLITGYKSIGENSSWKYIKVD